MTRDEFTKLFVYMEKRFDKIEAELAKKADADRVYGALDAIEKRLDTLESEMVLVNRQLARHERWHHQVAAHLGVTLTYD